MEQSTSSAAVLKLYNKWLEKSQQGEGAVEKKGGILKTIKSAIQKPGKEQVVSGGRGGRKGEWPEREGEWPGRKERGCQSST